MRSKRKKHRKLPRFFPKLDKATKKTIRHIRNFLIIAIVLTGLFWYWPRYEAKKPHRPPFAYHELILTEAAKYGMEPHLVAAVIQNESKFRPQAVSEHGAVGLMQLMPETAEWIAFRMGEGQITISREQLSQPDLNIRYGTWYLDHLYELFEGNDYLVLAAYNAGSGVVFEWMEEYGWDYGFSDIPAIPYGETRHYVEHVLKARDQYDRMEDKHSKPAGANGQKNPVPKR